MTDPIADLLVRIRNASFVSKTEVEMPFSKIKEAILSILKDEGFVKNYKIVDKKNKKFLNVEIANSKPLSHVKQISKPGRRIYVKAKDAPIPLRGLGLAIISTPSGVISTKAARKKGVGGELICEIW